MFQSIFYSAIFNARLNVNFSKQNFFNFCEVYYKAFVTGLLIALYTSPKHANELGVISANIFIQTC